MKKINSEQSQSITINKSQLYSYRCAFSIIIFHLMSNSYDENFMAPRQFMFFSGDFVTFIVLIYDVLISYDFKISEITKNIIIICLPTAFFLSIFAHLIYYWER